jgi:hypothetical protein
MPIAIQKFNENFDFCSNFCNQGHDESEIQDETTIKLRHVIENLNVFGDFQFQHVDNGCNFFRIR